MSCSVLRAGSQPFKKKKKGSDPTFEARLFQVDAITGEDVSSLETRFEAGVDEQTGLCVFSPRASEDELS